MYLTYFSIFYFVVFFFSVYLYGFAAKQDYRKAVPQIRKGEYEGLKEKVVMDSLLYFCPILFRPLLFGNGTGQ